MTRYLATARWPPLNTASLLNLQLLAKHSPADIVNQATIQRAAQNTTLHTHSASFVSVGQKTQRAHWIITHPFGNLRPRRRPGCCTRPLQAHQQSFVAYNKYNVSLNPRPLWHPAQQVLATCIPQLTSPLLHSSFTVHTRPTSTVQVYTGIGASALAPCSCIQLFFFTVVVLLSTGSI